MVVTVAGISTEVNSVLPKAFSAILVNPFPMPTVLRPESLNAIFPMTVTLSGIMIAVRLSHLKNAEFPIASTLSGMITPERVLHSEKAEVPIVFTVSGIVTDTISSQK